MKKPCKSKIYKAALVPRTGIEPALPFDNKILSLARLPIPPSGLKHINYDALKRDAMLRHCIISSKTRL